MTFHNGNSEYDTLLEIVKKSKLRWFGHVMRAKVMMVNTILHGKVEGKRSRGRPARRWLDDVKEWIKRKASKTVVGRCKGMDHEEGQQDGGWTM